jgi:cellulose synthase (UDP-forming)
VANVLFGRSLGFVVTSKERQSGGPSWGLIRPQLVAIALLAGSAVVGIVRAALGVVPAAEGTWVNVGWVVYDIVVLSVIIQAARFRGSEAHEEEHT